MIKVKIVNKSGYPNPTPATPGSAGVDLRACITEEMELKPGGRLLIPTGLFMAIPEDYELQIRPRSGLAYKHGITVLNSPGTIDSDYRKEVQILLVNLTREPFMIKPGERIAQGVFNKIEPVLYYNFDTVEELGETHRAGGFGHTGTK
jgi:dUTP pyrophosphatase